MFHKGGYTDTYSDKKNISCNSLNISEPPVK